MSNTLVAVRLYRDNNKNHIDTVYYLENVIFHMTNKDILDMVKNDYKLSYNLTGVSPQWGM
jgi:hypothetical protein